MDAQAGWHLAQVNIALPRAPVDSALLRDFVELLGPVNALADAAPGFVWRMQTEDGDATAVRGFDDDRLIINMSVWESLDALATFVYRTDHAAVMRRRREWFHRFDGAFTVLWWVPAGSRPTVGDAEVRLAALRERGPTSFAFTFRQPFPPELTEAVPRSTDDWTCDA